MNNISFKGFYEVKTIGNKRANTKLISALFDTIPDAVYSSYPKTSSLFFYVPEKGEAQFEKLAEALKAKSLVKIRNIDYEKQSLNALLCSRIIDFEPSADYSYVTVSTEELKKKVGLLQDNDEESICNSIFKIGLLDSKINIPEISIKTSENKNKNKDLNYHNLNKIEFSVIVPDSSKAIISSFIKLGYDEIPVKISKNDLEIIKKLTLGSENSFIRREIAVPQFKK